jgi:hypothetical protein
MRKRLTPAFALKAPLPEKGDRVIYWDPDPRGFGLMVTAAGRKSYVVQYRAHGRSRRYTLKGGLSLSAARKEATKLVHPSGIEGLIFGSWGYAIRREASLRRSSGRAWPWWR